MSGRKLAVYLRKPERDLSPAERETWALLRDSVDRFNAETRALCEAGVDVRLVIGEDRNGLPIFRRSVRFPAISMRGL